MYVDDIYPSEGTDEFYFDKNGNVVYTKEYLIKRGYCCGNGCLNCAYTPRHKKGSRKLK